MTKKKYKVIIEEIASKEYEIEVEYDDTNPEVDPDDLLIDIIKEKYESNDISTSKEDVYETNYMYVEDGENISSGSWNKL